MWELMNGMANSVRNRVMPRRRNGIGTMTAMVLGASVGIAAWETYRRSRGTQGSGLDANPAKVAQEVMNSLDE
jgi:hypothetical protein